MMDNRANTSEKDLSQMTFREMLNVSFKSDDTEEWLDVHFTRPVGLMFALGWMRFNVHPNVVTIISIVLGVAAAVMFAFPDLLHNIIGVVLLVLANLCDSTDGQMARLTGKKTQIGRMLDGFAGDVWFFAIYFAICVRLMGEFMPGTDVRWGVTIWALCAIAGFFAHAPQASLSDYYRQIHLWMLKGKKGSELDNSRQQRDILESLPKDGPFIKRLLDRTFYYNYANYCHSQEKRTPHFQRLYQQLLGRYGGSENLPSDLRREFLDGSRPLMKYANLLTFNLRAIVLYVACLANQPWIYPVFEIVVLSVMYIHMHKRHEMLCKHISDKYLTNPKPEV